MNFENQAKIFKIELEKLSEFLIYHQDFLKEFENHFYEKDFNVCQILLKENEFSKDISDFDSEFDDMKKINCLICLQNKYSGNFLNNSFL